MKDINVVVIDGRLVRDAELKNTAKGDLLHFSVAFNSSQKDEAGNYKDKVNYIKCNLWGARGKAISQYLKKGIGVAVEGELDFQSWTDTKTGTKRNKHEITCKEINIHFQNNRIEETERSSNETSSYDDIPF